MSKKKKQRIIRMSQDELTALKSRLERGILQPDDYKLLGALIDVYGDIFLELDKRKASIARLRQMIFGSSEKSKEPAEGNESSENAAGKRANRKKVEKGHGRNGVQSFSEAVRQPYPHPYLKKGDVCPECGRGHLHVLKSRGDRVVYKGSCPIKSEILELETLRCSGCQKVFKTPLPEDIKHNKFDINALSMLIMLKYGNGMPFYRLANLQRDVFSPLAASTQWEALRKTSHIFEPIYLHLNFLAAQGDVIHMDDTGVKIIQLPEPISGQDPKRKGTFTTGIVSRHEGFDIVLYFSGRSHAGENLTTLLAQREKELPAPIQMCDALSRNYPQTLVTILAHCLIHGRRQFTDIITVFPEECQHVVRELKMVYKNDQKTKARKMSPSERLNYHRKYSKPTLDQLHQWFSEQLSEKKVEPNSSLGDAMKYMLKHWKKMTRFLEVENCPLDNNLCELILKCAILNRKNALFYKSSNGAKVGDIYMSIIQTARQAKVNVFEYLNCLLHYEHEVKRNPERWLPWNYKKTLAIQKNANSA